MASSDHSKSGGDFIFTPRAAMSLDFANTLGWRGSSLSESLHGFADVLEWCVSAGMFPATGAAELRSWAVDHPRRAGHFFDDAIAMREAIYRVFHLVASGAAPEAADLATLNRALEEAPLRVNIHRTGDGFGWQVEKKISATALLAPVLWSAGDLLVGPQLAKVRECANALCLWLFLDDSKNRTRRWCSMQSCGNRAKAHRHYLRQKRA